MTRRPTSRAECINGPRPCPFISCRYHLWWEVSRECGHIGPTGPDDTLSPVELAETCALDVADRGPHTSRQLTAILGVGREWLRRVQRRAIDALQSNHGDDGELLDLLRHDYPERHDYSEGDADSSPSLLEGVPMPTRPRRDPLTPLQRSAAQAAAQLRASGQEPTLDAVAAWIAYDVRALRTSLNQCPVRLLGLTPDGLVVGEACEAPAPDVASTPATQLSAEAVIAAWGLEGDAAHALRFLAVGQVRHALYFLQCATRQEDAA